MSAAGKGSARYQRAKKVGWANQLAYEGTQRAEREAMQARMASVKRERRARAAQAGAQTARRTRGRSGRGMNAGTMGRARL
jgi:hypothetical protein